MKNNDLISSSIAARKEKHDRIDSAKAVFKRSVRVTMPIPEAIDLDDFNALQEDIAANIEERERKRIELRRELLNLLPAA